MDLEQHAEAAIERRRAAIEIEIPARGPGLERPETDRYTVGQGPLAELDELVGADDDVAERVPERLTLAETEKVLGCKIEVSDEELFVEGNDGDAEPAEDAVRAGCAGSAPGTSAGRCRAARPCR
jgi:hypothetical protein